MKMGIVAGWRVGVGSCKAVARRRQAGSAVANIQTKAVGFLLVDDSVNERDLLQFEVDDALLLDGV